MTTNNQFYKVVRKVKDGYRSAFIGSCLPNYVRTERASKFELKYSTTEWTEPNEITKGIYVFNSIESAERFTVDLLVSDKLEIWSCDVVNPRKFDKISYISNNEIAYFWNHINDLHHSDYKESPYGSYLVDKCKLLERIE